MALRISQGSGATLASNLINGEHLQVISPVSIYPLPTGTNSIGLVTVNGAVNINNLISLASGTQIGLNPSSNFIGLVSVQGNVVVSGGVNINNLISLASGQSIGLNPSSNYIGLASVNVGNVVNAVVTIAPRTDYLGLVSVSGNVNINGLTSLASGTEVRSLATILNFPATQAVSFNQLVSLPSGTQIGLNPSSNYVGLVTSTIANPTILISAPTLFAVVNTSAAGVGQSLVTINPRTDYIGLMSVSGNVNVQGLVSLASGTNVGLNGGTNFIGLTTTTISNPTILISAPTLFAVVNTSAAGVGQSLVTINPRTDYIGLMSVSGNVNVQGLISLASGTEVRSLATILNFPATQAVSFNQLVSLASGTEVRSLATILNFPATQAVSFNQLVSLASGTTILAAQSGSWSITDYPQQYNGSGFESLTGDGTNGLKVRIQSQAINLNALVTLYPRTDYIGLASVSGNVNINGLVSLASGTEVRSLATILNFPATQAVSFNQLVSLASGTEVRTRPISNVTLNASNAFIGLVTVANNVTVLGNNGSALAQTVGGNLILGASSNFIGLVTIFPGSTITTYVVPISAYTSLATVISASGNATLFPGQGPGTRYILKDLIIGSQGQTQVGIMGNASITIIPPIALATMGGYISNFGDGGLRSPGNTALIVTNGSAVTISVMANVRFE